MNISKGADFFLVNFQPIRGIWGAENTEKEFRLVFENFSRALFAKGNLKIVSQANIF